MKKLAIGILLIILLAGFGIIFRKQLFPTKIIHFHAGFQVYKNDKLQNFSDTKYMHEKPCTVNGKPMPGDHDDNQEEKAHLHDLVGDIVHIHRQNTTWADLFTNLKYPMESSAKGYINGKEADNFMQMTIQPYDSLVVFIGKNNKIKKELENAVTKAYIQKVEKYSENCSS